MLSLKIKKFLPTSLLNFLRGFRLRVYNFLDRFHPELNTINYCGFKLYYSRGYSLINRIRFGNPDRIYERALCEQLTAELKKHPSAFFLDIGANIGLISLYVLKHVPNSIVYGFEPGPHQYELLRTTVQKNRLEERFVLEKKAVGKEDGQTSFFLHNSVYSPGDGFLDTGRSGFSQKAEVEVIKLDTWWAFMGKPNIPVVKIDTEGAELWVLLGAEKFISALRPVIFFELTELNLKSYPYAAQDVISWLKNKEYNVFTLSGNLCELDNIEQILTREDTFLARPK